MFAMTTFRDSEKVRYERLKPILFSDKAQSNGNYRGIPRAFCLADGYSAENLHESIREDAIRYFTNRDIPWHDGSNRRRLPSNHLCCSQSCCINFLYPMTVSAPLLTIVFKQIYPDLLEPLRVDMDQPLSNGVYPYMAFEWIGVEDYLGETKRKGRTRTRGANFTSADFIFRFRRKDQKVQIVLGEWKYTEEYHRQYKGIEVRKQNYYSAFHKHGGVFEASSEDLYDSLFYDPFYQLMRLQLLAQEMEINKEMDADMVSVLHVCPEANIEFRERVTSPYLANLYPNKSTLEIWTEMAPKEKFTSVSVESLLSEIEQVGGSSHNSGVMEWVEYIKTRYGWNNLP